MRISDWSSDVCSSDLEFQAEGHPVVLGKMNEKEIAEDPEFLAEIHIVLNPGLAYLVNDEHQNDQADGFYTSLHSVLFYSGTGLTDRKSVVEGKSVSVSVELGGRRIIKKKQNIY